MLKHEDIVSCQADYHKVANIIGKMNDLCEYYGHKTGHYDSHASAEYFHEYFGYPRSQCQRIVRYLREQGVFFKARYDLNTYDAPDPSLGFTGYDKPHADKIWYHGVEKSVIRALLPIWQKLSQVDPLIKVLK